MVLSAREISRVAIFAFYDKDGIVDDYIPKLLTEMKLHCQKLLVVVNGTLTEEGKTKLEAVGAEILFRENEGFDISGYRAGILHLEENLHEYDELILLNQTIYGPIYPFQEMFDAMNKRDIDFWGITKHPGIPEDPWGTAGGGVVPEHIQSYYMVIRNKMLCSEEFIDYWKNLASISTYYEAVGGHEVHFTEIFESKGFKSDIYIDLSKLVMYGDYPMMFNPKLLVCEYKCPVVKRKVFFLKREEYLLNNTSEEPANLFQWLSQNTEFDTNLILQNLLRTENYYDITMSIAPIDIYDETDKATNGKLVAMMMYDNPSSELFEKLFSNNNVIVAFENEKVEETFSKFLGNSNIQKLPFDFKSILEEASKRKEEEVYFISNFPEKEVESIFLDKSLIEEGILSAFNGRKMLEENKQVGCVFSYSTLHGKGLTEQFDYENITADERIDPAVTCRSRCFAARKEVIIEMLKLIEDGFSLEDNRMPYIPSAACRNAKMLCGFEISKSRIKSDLKSARYMLDGITKIWTTERKRSYPNLLFRMQAILDFFNERRYQMTIDQAINGNLSFKEKMWITLQLFLKPKTFERVRKFLAGGKPPKEEHHEIDSVD